MSKYLEIDKTNYFENIYFIFNNFASLLDWAIYDIKLKFKRTNLGITWEFANILFLSFLISIVFSKILNQNFINYFHKILSGYSLWFFISKTISDSSKLLIERYNAHALNTRLPLIAYSFRSLLTNFIIYLIYLIIIIIISLLFFNISFFSILMVFFGLIIVFFNLLWICNFLSIISTRYRDISPLIQAILPPFFILTPILWDKSKLGIYENYIYLNPFTSFIEIIKEPLVGGETSFISYLILLSSIILGFSANAILYKFKGKNFIFWIH